MHLDELCPEWGVDGVKHKLVVLQGCFADRALPFRRPHANGCAVHEHIAAHVSAHNCFKRRSFCIAAQSNCESICFLLRPAARTARY